MRSRTPAGTRRSRRSSARAKAPTACMQALLQGRPLAAGRAGRPARSARVGGLLRPGRAQGRLLLAGGAVGALGLRAQRLPDRRPGWSFAAAQHAASANCAVNQFGIGAGRLRRARGADAARGLRPGAAAASSRATCSSPAAVIGCGVLLALFIAYPVSKALAGAFLDEDGRWSLAALRRRASAPSASGAWAAWPAACAAASPGTRWSWPCSRPPAPPCSAR